MGLLEQSAPGSVSQRKQQSGADKRATALVALGFALTLAAIIGLPGPDSWFMGAAPAIAIVSGFPALLGIMMARFRGGFARLFLFAGAVALAAVGAGYLGRAEGARIVIAYFIPAILFAGAALLLAAPRLQARAT